MKPARVTLLAASAALLAVTACTSIETPTDDPNQRQKEGAVIGAITGAVVGARAGKNASSKRNAAIVGAVVGGVAGGAIGKNLDQQAAELRSRISDDRVQIINDGTKLIVSMPNDILFPFDSDVVGSGLRGDLRTLADHLQRYPNSVVRVIGHTDSVGSASYNQDLSVRRARAVSSILVNNGVRSGRVRSIGMGEDDPVATNLTPEGRAQNRRVEIEIIPQG